MVLFVQMNLVVLGILRVLVFQNFQNFQVVLVVPEDPMILEDPIIMILIE